MPYNRVVGYRSGNTRSAGQQDIRGTSTKLLREYGNKKKKKKKTKTTTKRNNIEEGHSIERVWYTANREPSDTPPDRNYHAFAPKSINSIYNSVLSGFQVSLLAQSGPLGESLSRSNQRGSKTSQACYSHPTCNLNLVCLLCLSLPLPVFGRLFLFLHPRVQKPTTAFTYRAVPDPRSSAAVLQSPVIPNSRRSSAM